MTTLTRVIATVTLVLTTSFFATAEQTVDCTAGQSLNRAISKLDKHNPGQLMVKGNCTEYVQISGFDGLTLKGAAGATLIQPSGAVTPRLFKSLLDINASRSITVDGLNIQADTTTVPGVGIGHGSRDIRLRNLTVQGGTEGIIIYENSQVSIAQVVAQDAGFIPLGVYDASDVHVEHCILQQSTADSSWHQGIQVGASHVTMYGTTIRNMQVGISVSAGGVLDLVDFNTYYPKGGQTDVVIESPARTNFNGLSISGGSSVNLNTARLRIANPGQTWGGTTGGVWLTGASTLAAGSNLVIADSQGQGVIVSDNSQADLGGASITGSAHGGLVVINQSTAALGSAQTTAISGNGTDLFCDSRSLVTGGANLSGANNIQCTNLLPGDNVGIP